MRIESNKRRNDMPSKNRKTKNVSFSREQAQAIADAICDMYSDYADDPDDILEKVHEMFDQLQIPFNVDSSVRVIVL
jgi:2-oxoglutarate dehydrogenase complex dehydrogenase (E1) component-like enzyme